MRRTVAAAAVAAVGLAGPAAAEITGKAVTYEHADTTYQGYYARNTQLDGPLPTVLIVHDWDGLGAYEKRRAKMLAERGYAAFALDLYGKGVRPEGYQESKAQSQALYDDREAMRGRLEAGLAQLEGLAGADRSNTVAMGYCFGGQAVLELARMGADTQGFVAFHPSLGTPEGQDYAAVQAPMLFLHGTADEVAPMSAVAKLANRLDKAGIDQRWELYGGAPHAFTDFASQRYRPTADREAWRELMAFLASRLR